MMKFIILFSLIMGTVFSQDAKLVQTVKNSETSKIEKISVEGSVSDYELMYTANAPKSQTLRNLTLSFTKKAKSYDSLGETLQIIGTATINVDISDEKGKPVLSQELLIEILPHGMDFLKAMQEDMVLGAKAICTQRIKNIDRKGKKMKFVREFTCEFDKKSFKNSESIVFTIIE